jgi:hypothetical protein
MGKYWVFSLKTGNIWSFFPYFPVTLKVSLVNLGGEGKFSGIFPEFRRNLGKITGNFPETLKNS